MYVLFLYINMLNGILEMAYKRWIGVFWYLNLIQRTVIVEMEADAVPVVNSFVCWRSVRSLFQSFSNIFLYSIVRSNLYIYPV